MKVINPIVTDAYRNMLIRKTKKDRIDAEVVARVLKMGEYQETFVLKDDTLALRQLCRYRLTQTQTTSDLKRKVIALPDQVFPEYDTLFSDVFDMSSKELLQNYTTPEEIGSVHTRKLTNILNKASKGNFGKEKALEIKAVACQSIGITIATDAFAFQIRQLIQQIEFVEIQVESLDEEIASYMESVDSPITTIPGIGPVYGAALPNWAILTVFLVASRLSLMQS